MNYLKNSNGDIFAYSDIQTVPSGLTPLTESEVQEHLHPVIPPVIPQRISKAQAKTWLIQNGKYQAVLDYIDAIPDATQKLLAQVAWNDSDYFDRSSTTLASIASGLGWTSEDLDTWFTEAAQLVI